MNTVCVECGEVFMTNRHGFSDAANEHQFDESHHVMDRTGFELAAKRLADGEI